MRSQYPESEALSVSRLPDRLITPAAGESPEREPPEPPRSDKREARGSADASPLMRRAWKTCCWKPSGCESISLSMRCRLALCFCDRCPDAAGMPMADVEVQRVFIGSCTNGRIEDMRAVAEVAKGRQVADGVRAMVVPGSGLVKEQAEAEGIADILKEAGFEWREPGCSMCLAMNTDRLDPGERCASTTNRNFVGRQGRDGRTHLVSPAMAAAAAVTGKLSDVRQLIS